MDVSAILSHSNLLHRLHIWIKAAEYGLGIMIAASIASKIVTSEERETLSYESLASMRLKWRQEMQMGLEGVTALTAMYLFSFSVLGVAGLPNISILIIGVVGAMALFLLIMIEVIVIIASKVRDGEQPAGSTINLCGRKFLSVESEKKISIRNISGEMKLVTLIKKRDGRSGICSGAATAIK